MKGTMKNIKQVNRILLKGGSYRGSDGSGRPLGGCAMSAKIWEEGEGPEVQGYVGRPCAWQEKHQGSLRWVPACQGAWRRPSLMSSVLPALQLGISLQGIHSPRSCGLSRDSRRPPPRHTPSHLAVSTVGGLAPGAICEGQTCCSASPSLRR